MARERDLCDVKIKITEYFPGAAFTPSTLDPGIESLNAMGQQSPSHFLSLGSDGRLRDEPQPFGVLAPSASLPSGHPGATGARYYTIQRVNGNGANGRGDGIGGPHRHTLEDSDRVKKNSIQRRLLKDEKEKKKTLVSIFHHFLICDDRQFSLFFALFKKKRRRTGNYVTYFLFTRPFFFLLPHHRIFSINFPSNCYPCIIECCASPHFQMPKELKSSKKKERK